VEEFSTAGQEARQGGEERCGHPSARRIRIHGSLVFALRQRDAVESAASFRGHHVSPVYPDDSGWIFVICRECGEGILRTAALAALRDRHPAGRRLPRNRVSRIA
jgi:hypothetical protein